MKSAPTKSYPTRVLAAAAILLPIYLVILLCAGHLMRVLSAEFAYNDWQASMPLTVEDPFEWGTTDFPGADAVADKTLKPAAASFGMDYPPVIAAAHGCGLLEEYIVLPRMELASSLHDRETGLEGRVAYDRRRDLFVWWIRTKTGAPVYCAFAGPEGVAQECSANLGRFEEPPWQVLREKLLLIVWDPASQRFYRYDLTTGQRTVGPIMQEGFHCSQIGSFLPMPLGVGVWWQPPAVKSQETQPSSQWQALPGYENSRRYWGEFVPALLDDGRIVKVDLETLQMGNCLGRVLVQPDRTVMVEDLLAYDASFLTYQGEYLGMAVGAMHGDAQHAAVTVWNAKGVLWDEQRMRLESQDMTQLPGGALGVVEYLLELVHPPVLMAGTHLVGRPGVAAAGWRSLLWRPYGFAAQIVQAPAEDGKWLAAVVAGMAMLLPGLAVSCLLAYWVTVDAQRLGLGKGVRRGWMWATVLGGVGVWLVYRLSRPAVAVVGRVTCVNCGRLRRSDQETCHWCGAKWRVPEAEKPGWRVVQELC